MKVEPARLQDYLRGTAQLGRDVVDAGAFVVTIDPFEDMRFLNYAVPAAGADAEDARGGESRVRAVMAARGRLPRVECLPSATPGIEAAMTAAGWEVESRVPVMTCGVQTVRVVERPPGLELVEVEPSSDRDLVRMLLRTPREAFGEDPDKLTEAQVDRWREGSGAGVLARLYGVPVAAGQITPVADGLSEVAGIGTRHPYRRRGLAGAVTEALARMAFARGADVVFLSPGDAGAERVYARAGFAVDGEVLALVAPAG